MNRPSLLAWILAIALLGAGCAPLPIAATGSKKPPRASDVANQPEPTASTTPVADPAKAYRGTVLGLDGLPAANVTVRGHLISNNGSGLLSDRGSSIISANGGSYRLLSESALEVQTDAEGHFNFQHPENQPLNLEAIAGPDLKAIRFNVAADATDVTLQLAPTGAISGKVTAPEAPGVTDFQGVDVYIPGTGYLAKTATSGAYTIPNVPVGSFTLAAEKTGLGSGQVKDVAVESKKTTTAPNLPLSVTVPTIASITPAHAAPGIELEIKGEHFGSSTGAPLEVRIGGVDASTFERLDDKTIKVKVPGSAGSDGVVVKVNQIASASKPFQVLQSLTLTPETRRMVVGATLQFSVSAKDTNGQPVDSPLVTWSATGVGATVADGLVKAEAVGTASIEVVAGPSLKKTLPLGVVATAADLPGNDDLVDTSALVTNANGVFVLGYENLFKLNPTDGTTTAHVGPRSADPAAQYNLEYAEDLVTNTVGDFYAASGDEILKIAADKTVSTFASGFSSITAMGMSPTGTLHVVDEEEGLLREVSPAGVVSSAPGLYGMYGFDRIAVAPDGTVYLASYTGVYKATESGPEPLEDAQGNAFEFEEIAGLAVGPNGDVIVADTDWNTNKTKIHRITPSTGASVVPTLSPVVSLGYLGGMAVDAEGKLLVIDADKGKFYRLTVEEPTL